MTMIELSNPNQDAATYLPSTSLNYRGFMHYTVCRVSENELTTVGFGDRLAVINTNMDINNTFQPNLSTIIHIFRWNWGVLGWDYVKSGSLDSESAWMPFEGTYGTSNEDNSIYRIISSQSQNIIFQGSTCFGAPPHISGDYDNFGGIVPTSQNGNLIPTPGQPANFYCLVHSGCPYPPDCVIGNVGNTEATYKIYQYVPRNTTVPDENWPTTLAGSSGYYVYKGTHTLPVAFSAGNPYAYGIASDGYDPMMTNSTGYLGLWKVELTGGGPIQVHAGGNIDSWFAGASNLHTPDGRSAGSEFWFFTGKSEGTACYPSAETYVINCFSPKKNVKVRLLSSDGHNWAYSTNGPDQAIAWMRFTTIGIRNAYKITVEPDGEQGSLVTQFQQCAYTEKFLTAPFVETGVHYKIYAPAVAYAGQSFLADGGGGWGRAEGRRQTTAG